MQQTRSSPLPLVCVADPEDAPLLRHWETHLRSLEQAGLISFPSYIEAISHRARLVPLAICSRQSAYEDASTRQRLVLQSAVIVQLLSEVQRED